MDERDHLHVTINLATEEEGGDASRIAAMSQRLEQVETEIVAERRIPH